MVKKRAFVNIFGVMFAGFIFFSYFCKLKLYIY